MIEDAQVGPVDLAQQNLDFSIEKAKRELGYLPRYTFQEGMYETMAYYQQNS